MSARKIDWQMCRGLDLAPPRPDPEARRCDAEGCRAWASFGFRGQGWSGFRDRGRVFCGEHREMGVALLNEGRAA